MVTLSPMQEELCTQNTWDFSDLSALFINTTLKKSPEMSHTQGLIDVSAEIMRRQGVAVDMLRAVDQSIAAGVWPDMTEHGWEEDDWPETFERVMNADILVLGTPIWLGEKSSVCATVIERLYGNSHLLNDAGQYAYYGCSGGPVATAEQPPTTTVGCADASGNRSRWGSGRLHPGLDGVLQPGVRHQPGDGGLTELG